MDYFRELQEANKKWLEKAAAGVNPECTPLTATKKAKNYTSTLAEHIANGRKLVPLPVLKSRREQCNACPHRDAKKDTCKLCGCPLHKTVLGDKLAWAVSKCPIGKWEKYADNEDCCP